MSALFIIVFFLVSFFMIGLILLQEGKGGGLTGMSTGMDGVMGAKNPLRRMTAYLFVFFVVLAVTINWYFHQRNDVALPAGIALPEPPLQLPEGAVPWPGPDAAAGTASPLAPPPVESPEAPAESTSSLTPPPAESPEAPVESTSPLAPPAAVGTNASPDAAAPAAAEAEADK